MYSSNTMQSQLASLGFKTVEDITDRSSFGALLRTKRRCGIYVLHFKNGWYYVGQSVNVVRRCSAHWKNYTDIQTISFKPMARRSLDQEEFDTIGALEGAGWQLRNKTLVSIRNGKTKFDDIMSPSDQRRWLSDLKYVDFSGTRTLDIQQRERYAQNYRRYQCMPMADQITAVLRKYVQKCIPVPVRSEMAFWGSSCLPSYGGPNVTIYSRINVYWQEVFTASQIDGTVGFSWHLADKPFEDSFFTDNLGSYPRASYPTMWTSDHAYISGGSDQFNIGVDSIEEALLMLDDVNIIKAARLFNMRLCQKGRCNNARYHCFDLADELLDIRASN